MISHQTDETARRAQAVYDQKLKQLLEAAHRDAFVAIEPESGEYFLGKTLSEAIQAARQAHPDRLSHAFRVGHPVTVHLGVAEP